MRQKYGHHPWIAAVVLLFAAGAASGQQFAPPEPYGGKDAVEWMLEQEQHYPAEALAAGISGEVGVSFQILADGSVRNLRVTLPLEAACDAEALRLAALIRWKPASTNGTAFQKDHAILVPFNAKRYTKLHAKRKACPPLPPGPPAALDNLVFKDNEVDSLARPRLDGGLRRLPAWLAENLKYPQEAYRLDIQGDVSIEFVVEASGTVSNMRTLNFLGGGCDAEAMRLVRSLCWVPAVKNGQRVRSIMKLDIRFRLDPSRH
jgi:TonB family protein